MSDSSDEPKKLQSASLLFAVCKTVRSLESWGKTVMIIDDDGEVDHVQLIDVEFVAQLKRLYAHLRMCVWMWSRGRLQKFIRPRPCLKYGSSDPLLNCDCAVCVYGPYCPLMKKRAIYPH